MIIRSIFKLALVLLISSSFIACGGKKNEPIQNSQGDDSEKLVITDLKAEVEIVASREVTLTIIATKGFESNIYRDGKIVSIGNYNSDGENITNLKTTISHKGRALVCAFLFRKKIDEEITNPINIKIKIKLYKNNKLIQEYENTRTITSENDSTSEEFDLWGKV